MHKLNLNFVGEQLTQMMKNSTSINEVSSFPHDSVQYFSGKPSIVSEDEAIILADGPVPLCAKPSLLPQVRISQFSQLFIIPYDDAKLKWYTQDEQHLFNRARLSDAMRLRNLLQDETQAAEKKQRRPLQTGWTRDFHFPAHRPSCSPEEECAPRGRTLGTNDTPG